MISCRAARSARARRPRLGRRAVRVPSRRWPGGAGPAARAVAGPAGLAGAAGVPCSRAAASRSSTPGSTRPVTTGTIARRSHRPGPAAAAARPRPPRRRRRRAGRGAGPGSMCSRIWVGCPARSGRHPDGDQPPARLLQRVVLALALGPQILRARPLAQRVQHRLQRRGALRGQVPVQLPGAAEGGVQPHPPVREPVIAVVVGPAQPAPHLLGQRAQVGQRPRRRPPRASRIYIRVRRVLLGQQVGPVADLPRPRRRELPGGQRPADRRMRRQPAHPAHRPRRRRRW